MLGSQFREPRFVPRLPSLRQAAYPPCPAAGYESQRRIRGIARRFVTRSWYRPNLSIRYLACPKSRRAKFAVSQLSVDEEGKRTQAAVSGPFTGSRMPTDGWHIRRFVLSLPGIGVRTAPLRRCTQNRCSCLVALRDERPGWRGLPLVSCRLVSCCAVVMRCGASLVVAAWPRSATVGTTASAVPSPSSCSIPG
jgi:hypothetical protein